MSVSAIHQNTLKITFLWDVMVGRLWSVFKRRILPPSSRWKSKLNMRDDTDIRGERGLVALQASDSFYMMVMMYQTTWCHIPEDSNILGHCHERLSLH
jgi:hypothetical protein